MIKNLDYVFIYDQNIKILFTQLSDSPTQLVNNRKTPSFKFTINLTVLKINRS